MKLRERERLHPAVWPGGLLILISVGRLPELFPFLGPLQLGKISVLWAAAAFVLGPRDVGTAAVFSHRLGKLLIVWFAFAMVSVLWSVWRSHSLAFLFGGLLINLILFFVIASTTTNMRTLRFYATTLLLATCLLSITAITTAMGGAQQRVAVSAAYDPNDLAMVLVVMLPMAVAYMFTLRGMRRAAMLTLCGTVLLGILLTGSRGGFLGLVVVGVYLCCARLPRPDGQLAPRYQVGKFAAAALGGILLMATVPGSVWERLASMSSLTEDYNVTGTTGRIAIWSRGLEAMAVRPWGYGVAVFESVEGGQGGRYKAAHNIWIEMGVELGVQGIVLLMFVFGTAFAVTQRARLQPPRAPPWHWTLPVALGLRGALIGYLVTGFFLSVTYHGIFFALLGLIAGLDNLVRSTETAPAAPSGESEKSNQLATVRPVTRRYRGPTPTAPVGGRRPISGERHTQNNDNGRT